MTYLTFYSKGFDLIWTPMGIINTLLCLFVLVASVTVLANKKILTNLEKNFKLPTICGFLILTEVGASNCYGIRFKWIWIVYLILFVACFISFWKQKRFRKNNE